MNFSEIKAMVIAEYDSRNLKSDVRYRALDQFDEFLKKAQFLPLWNDVSEFPKDKNLMKEIYRKIYKEGRDLSGAESSMLNEIYNQLTKTNITLTDVKL